MLPTDSDLRVSLCLLFNLCLSLVSFGSDFDTDTDTDTDTD